MTTIKSFTDLQQSKKLAEILPIESADMSFLSEESLVPKVICYGMVFFNIEEERPSTIIPCWSLAALLSIIPQEIFNGEYIINITEGLNNRWMLTYDNYEIGNHPFYGLSIGNDNLIDACYEMILKLNELNLL